ncbi:MAG: endo-1,4-beta-xylanase [Flavobacteriaceae bacterium]
MKQFRKTAFLLALLMLGLSQCSSEPTQEGLKDLSNYPIGTAINLKATRADQKKLAITKKEFNSLTAENNMKMFRLLPQENEYHWEVTEDLVDFAQKNNMRLFGHALVWHSGTPQWVKDKLAKDSLWGKAFLKDYITTVVSKYKGKVKGWDVVNEPLETQGGALRETEWLKALGPSYMAQALEAAHAADPQADLFINDFNLERDTLKLNGLLSLVEQLKSQATPLTGIGFQMHYRMDIPDSLILKCLQKAAATGLKIHLSEVDLIFNKHNDSQAGGIQKFNDYTPEMAKAQAAKYKRLVALYHQAVPEAQRYGITFWGFNDRDTWIKPFFKIKDWPTLFDEQLNPKKAYWGFREGLVEQHKMP